MSSDKSRTVKKRAVDDKAVMLAKRDAHLAFKRRKSIRTFLFWIAVSALSLFVVNELWRGRPWMMPIGLLIAGVVVFRVVYHLIDSSDPDPDPEATARDRKIEANLRQTAREMQASRNAERATQRAIQQAEDAEKKKQEQLRFDAMVERASPFIAEMEQQARDLGLQDEHQLTDFRVSYLVALYSSEPAVAAEIGMGYGIDVAAMVDIVRLSQNASKEIEKANAAQILARGAIINQLMRRN